MSELDEAGVYIRSIGCRGPIVALTPREFANAFSTLTVAERNELYGFADIIAWHYSHGPDGRDLLHQAIEATLSERRRCPDDVDVVVYLKNVIRSIASNVAKYRRRERTAIYELAAGGHDQFASDPSRYEEESETIIQKRRQRVLDMFAGEADAQRLMALLLQGYGGAELQDLLNLDDVAYASLRKKVRRRLNRMRRNLD